MHISVITAGKYSGISNDDSQLVKVICVSKGVAAIDLDAFSVTECLLFMLHYGSSLGDLQVYKISKSGLTVNLNLNTYPLR